MINLSIRTTTERKTVIVDAGASIKNILAEADVDITGKSFQLNGVPLTAADLVVPINTIGAEDNTTAMLVAAVKADSAK